MSEEEKAKHDVIEAVCQDEEKAYGSKLNTLKHAEQINKDITVDGKNKCMNRVSFRNKKGYTNYNSFIVNFPRDELLVDIADMGSLKGEYHYLFLCTDTF